jgi:tight adherence protein B
METFFYLIKYLVVILFFLSIYWLILSIKPGIGEELAAKFERFKTRYLKDTEKLLTKGKQRMDAKQVLRLSLWCAAGGMLLGMVVGGSNLLDAGSILLGLSLAAVGFAGPRLMLAAQQRQRQKALDAQLPDALELIANSVRAGLSLVQALEVVANDAPKPVSEEFTEILRDVRLGLAPEEALEKLSMHWKNQDLELFVIAANVSRRTGGNLADVAGQIVETVRERVRLKGRIDSLTAQGIMSGWVVGLLPAGLLVAMSLLDPELIGGFVRHPLGMVMLGAGAVMELVGALVIKKIVNIDI